jgi:hypothetical protein
MAMTTTHLQQATIKTATKTSTIVAAGTKTKRRQKNNNNSSRSTINKNGKETFVPEYLHSNIRKRFRDVHVS